MRTLVRKRCGSSEEEDEDGGGRDGPRSATDEDFARCPCGRSARGRSQNTQGRAFDRRVSETILLSILPSEPSIRVEGERERETNLKRDGRERSQRRIGGTGPLVARAVLEFLAHAS